MTLHHIKQLLPAMAASVLLLGCDASGVGLPSCDEQRWIGVWGAAPTTAITEYQGQSLRLIASPTRGGTVARVVLSNRFGSAPLTLDRVWLGKQDKDATLVAGTNQQLTFGGQETITIPAGRDIASDAVEISYAAFETLAVSVDIPTPGEVLTEHSAALQTSWISEPGSGGHAEAESGDGFAESISTRPLLIGIEAQASARHSAVVAIGDSITDGAGSETDENTRYPDYLARRINHAGVPLSVINLGISGNRILQDGLIPSMGPSLQNRLEADVLARSDVSVVILLEGINDLALPPQPSATEVIDGIKSVVQRLKEPRPGKLPITVLLGTLTPTGSAEGFLAGHRDAEERRQEINAFIRTTDIADGVVDFDAAIQDPEEPTNIAAPYDSGDGLHPSAAGYEQMAEAVDLALLNAEVCAN